MTRSRQPHSPGDRVIAYIPGDAILKPHTGPAMVIHRGDRLVRLQMEGLVPAHRVYDHETGTHGPGWLDAPIIDLEPQHVRALEVRPPHPGPVRCQRQLEPVRVFARHLAADGTELGRSEPELITGTTLSWMQVAVRGPGRVKFCIVPALPVPLMPLEYAVWEPVL